MQIKLLNSYRITHKDTSIENICAENLTQALANMQTSEEESPVMQTFLVKENLSTVMEELPPEVLFTTLIAEEGSGFLATPASGKIHVGDSIAMKAVPARGYDFVSWTRNGRFISDRAEFVYEMTPLLEGEDTAVFTANFAPSAIPYTSSVSPEQASGAGCVAFPDSGTVEANGTLKLIAVESTGYTFDHWERNGETLGTNKILETTVTPLSENENTAEYVAVFTEQ